MKRGYLPMSALGKRVTIRFEDHSIGEPSKTICEVSGLVDKIEDSNITLMWWTVFSPNTQIPELHEDNHEFCTIVQGTIRQWGLCEPIKWNKVG